VHEYGETLLPERNSDGHMMAASEAIRERFCRFGVQRKQGDIIASYQRLQ
jgi:hypothetical protein